MKRLKLAIIIPLFMLPLYGCESETGKESSMSNVQSSPGLPPQNLISGKAISTDEAGQYVFVEVESSGAKVWVAASKVSVNVGDTIEFAEIQPMVNFFSKSLNKTFDKIYFVGSLKVNDKWAHASPADFAGKGSPVGSNGGSVGVGTAAEAVTVEKGSVKKAEGGYTVEELFQKKGELNGKTASVRGKVTKFLTGIMGKNWIHLKDGTGGQGTDDLSITTDDIVKVGDTVLVKGMIVAGKDFGAGYKYDLIIENGKATVQ